LLLVLPATADVKLCWAKSAYFNLSSSNFSVHDHVVSTAGDALSSSSIQG
jgi:hypothetical protein